MRIPSQVNASPRPVSHSSPDTFTASRFTSARPHRSIAPFERRLAFVALTPTSVRDRISVGRVLPGPTPGSHASAHRIRNNRRLAPPLPPTVSLYAAALNRPPPSLTASESVPYPPSQTFRTSELNPWLHW